MAAHELFSDLHPDPARSAEAVGLRYVTGAEPGITRRRQGKGFSYRGPDGKPVSAAERKRITALAIPPAWTEVWISPWPDAHLLATGRDEKGRKQYRYHPQWHDVRNETKFHRMVAFGEALPALRERVEQDLTRPGLPREKVLAAVVRLLEATMIRVGNREYARNNQHYGLTTLRDGHVDVSGATIHFEFTGKSGKEHAIEVQDRRLARIVRQCRDLPGQTLFQYLDESGSPQRIGSGDVNGYLREATGQDFTAKDFRTWAGTVLATTLLQDVASATSEREAKRAVTEAVKEVAAQLGNTPTVSRRWYIHPGVLSCFMDGSLPALLEQDRAEGWESLAAEEATVMHLLHCMAEP